MELNSHCGCELWGSFMYTSQQQTTYQAISTLSKITVIWR